MLLLIIVPTELLSQLKIHLMKNKMKALGYALLVLAAVGSALLFSYITDASITLSLCVAGMYFLLASALGKDTVLGIVTQNPFIGRARKSAGNMTMTTWKGLNVLKTKPLSVANPQTDGQMQQRSVLSQMVAIFRHISAAVNAGFVELAIHMSRYNAFLGVNMDEAFDMSAPPVATLLWEDLSVSRGSMYPTAIASFVADRSDNSLLLTWSGTVDAPGQSLTDKCYVVFVDEQLLEYASILGTAIRSDAGTNLAMPAAWQIGDTARCYLFFASPDGRKSSDSQNTSSVIVA